MAGNFYRIYYRIEPSFREDKNLTVEDIERRGTHRMVIPALFDTSLENIYTRMQGDFMTPEIRDELTRIRATDEDVPDLHTSMSVGDVVENRGTGKYYQCCDFGFEEVPEAVA